jgi:chromate transporter
MIQRLWEVAWLFLKMGALSFGGPAAYIALMEEEAVARRRWMSRERFLDLLGISNLIPGPNAVELANQIGCHRAGWLGLLVAGTAFCLPGVLITSGLAWGYVRYHSLPAIQPVLLGIKPVVVAIVAAAIGRLGRRALRTAPLMMIGVAVGVAALAGVSQVGSLLAGGALGALFLHGWNGRPTQRANTAAGALAAILVTRATFAAQAGGAIAVASLAQPVVAFSLGRMALFFVEVGSLLYGTGYVLIAYLQEGLVERFGWITHQQLVDAVAAGQITPGPLLSTVTFLGYLMAGLPGAALATIAVVVPSFVLVAITFPLVMRMRDWRWAGLFLDAIGAASIGVMVSITVYLANATLVDFRSWGLALAALALTLRWRIPSGPLVLAGAAVGWLLFR